MMLNDKVAIVTGSARGIGKGVAHMLAKNAAMIVVSDLDQEACEKVAAEISSTHSIKAIGIRCDMSKLSDVNDLVKKTMDKFGRIDILVNNAGIFPYKDSLEITEEDWDRLMDINLKGLFFLSQNSAKVMVPGSRIINISSIASVQAFSGLAHYCSSKGGVNGLTRGMALDLAPKGINVNAVLPGAIDTPGASGAMDVESKSKTAQMIPLKRWGTPEDIAGAVVYLASELSSYVTGQTIIVDGGWTIQ
jgi:NAD(P)-dependent dehydrogenase (short-subunit alcohol dehydrogenase family)